MLEIAFGVLFVISVLVLHLLMWQYLEGAIFRLHRYPIASNNAPAITVLKPLKGCDRPTEECLRSWFNQDFGGQIQLLFGVASTEDPVCEVVRSLMRQFPDSDAELVTCPKQFGPNAKVSTLIQLMHHAKHEVIGISDADVWAPPELLASMADALAKPGVGLVNCFYRLENLSNLAMRLEGVAVNADFWTQVLLARRMNPIDFALGAVMLTTKTQLATIGGFEVLVDYLADDYQLGNRTARSGARVEICPVVVECRSEVQTWQEVWKHQVRWARTIRACRPVQYFFSILANATLWPFLLVIARLSGLWYGARLLLESPIMPPLILIVSWLFEVLVLAVALLLRAATAVHLQKRLTRKTDHYPWFFLAPLKDLAAVFVWAAAFLGNTVEWRGTRYRILRGGKLVPLQKN